MKWVEPTPNYQMLVPDDITFDDADESVSNLWRSGSECALQLSSYRRESGLQIGAKERLRDRIAKTPGKWTELVMEPQSPSGQEVAAAFTTDQDGYSWVHIYVVWPELTVYATVSRPLREPAENQHWAIDAVRSLQKRSPE